MELHQNRDHRLDRRIGIRDSYRNHRPNMLESKIQSLTIRFGLPNHSSHLSSSTSLISFWLAEKNSNQIGLFVIGKLLFISIILLISIVYNEVKFNPLFSKNEPSILTRHYGVLKIMDLRVTRCDGLRV